MRFHPKIAALPLLALAVSVSGPAFAETQDPPPTDAAAAPEQQTDDGYLDDENEIVVTAIRPRGGVETDVTPTDELSEADVQSMGASSIEDVLSILAPQTGSGRARGSGGPVILLNGRRISSFRELRDIPPEAIERIQIFPEEVALQYGYRPDQRVVNFILKANFASANMEVELGGPDRGGQPRREVSGAFTQIGKNGRFNVAGSYQFQGLLTEDERGIVTDANSQFPYAIAGNVTGLNGAAIPGLGTATIAGVPNANPTLGDFAGTAGVANSDDTSAFRTLTPETHRWRVNATWNRTLSTSTDLTINGSYELNESRSLLGLANESFLLPATSQFSPFDGDVTVNHSFENPRPLERRSTTSTVSVGAGMNGLIGEKWRWSATADFSSADSRSITTRGLDTAVLEAAVAAGVANPFASDFGSGLVFAPADEARTLANTLSTSAIFNGTLFRLPAGEIQSTVRVGYARTDLDSTSLRSTGFIATTLGRDDADASINVNLPIADSREDVLGFLGRFSINANLGYHELSDFGGLVSYGAGFVWAPTNRLSITGSWIGDEKAPSVGDLGNPVVVTPNVATYDQVRGETVLATITSGGNPTLRSESREDLKFGINWQPPIMDDLNVQLEYFRNRGRDVTSAFPLLTPEIEAAFPGRVTRDASGRLVALDERSINFSRTFSDSLRLGLNVGGNIGKAPEGGGPMAGMGRPGGGGGGGPRMGRGGGGGGPRMGGGGGRFGQQGGGRWMLGLAYTYHIREEVEIAPGLPILDLLDGDTTSAGGGQGRHELSLESGVFYKGFGARLSGNYESATRVDGNSLTGTGDLFFSDLATINLRLFADLDQQKWLTDKVGFLKGSRISLGIDNVFDTIQDVRDGSGAVPLRYQPGFIDPAGRVIELEFRRRF